MTAADTQSLNDNYITLDSVSKTYGDDLTSTHVLNNISLSVAAGEQLAVLGHSGCGKSTLLNLISGIDNVDSGRITVGGVELTGLSEKDRTLFRREHIGFVYQSFNLIQTLTAVENIQLPLQLNNFSAAEIKDKTEEILDRVGLANRANAFPDQLSGGEQQRVAIARAMVHSPSLVLADEHTGNLDADTGREMIQLFTELAESRKQTVLMVTHSLTIAKTASRLVRFSNGELLTDENADSSLAW